MQSTSGKCATLFSLLLLIPLKISLLYESWCLLFLQVHELIALEILTLLLENPTDDSVEVAIGFLKECGLKLSEVAPKGMHGTCV